MSRTFLTFFKKIRCFFSTKKHFCLLCRFFAQIDSHFAVSALFARTDHACKRTRKAAACTVGKEQSFSAFLISLTAGAKSAHIYVARRHAQIFQKRTIDSGKIGMSFATHRAGRKQRHIAVNIASNIFRPQQPRKRCIDLVADLIAARTDTRPNGCQNMLHMTAAKRFCRANRREPHKPHRSHGWQAISARSRPF